MPRSTRSCILRPPAVGTDRAAASTASPRRSASPLRGQDGGAFGATRALLPYAPEWAYFDGIDSEAWAGVALLGFPVATGVPADGDAGGCRTIPGSPDPRSRLPHEVHTAVFDWVLALIAEAGLVKGERIGVDASTMEANFRRCATRAEGHGRGLPGDAGALGPRAVSRHPRLRTWRVWTLQAQGQEALEPGLLGLQERPRGQDRQAHEGRHHAPGLQARARGGSGHRRGGGSLRSLHPADEGDTTTLPKRRGKPRGGGCGADGRIRPNVDRGWS